MNMQRTLKILRSRANDIDFDVDDLLGGIGLARRHSAVSYAMGAVGFLVAGAAIGAGLGLMFAPSSGRRTRQTVEERISNLREKFAPNGHVVSDGLHSGDIP